MEITYELTLNYLLDGQVTDSTSLSTVGPCAEELVSTFVRTMVAHSFSVDLIGKYIKLDRLEVGEMLERREY